jgi:hypothetical protein
METSSLVRIPGYGRGMKDPSVRIGEHRGFGRGPFHGFIGVFFLLATSSWIFFFVSGRPAFIDKSRTWDLAASDAGTN